MAIRETRAVTPDFRVRLPRGDPPALRVTCGAGCPAADAARGLTTAADTNRRRCELRWWEWIMRLLESIDATSGSALPIEIVKALDKRWGVAAS